MQPVATHPCRFGGHFGVFDFCSCSCCSRRTPKMRCVFANATFAGGRATARSHKNRSRGVVLSCCVRWHMRGGIRVRYHARAPQQREQRNRFGHCPPPPGCTRRAPPRAVHRHRPWHAATRFVTPSFFVCHLTLEFSPRMAGFAATYGGNPGGDSDPDEEHSTGDWGEWWRG